MIQTMQGKLSNPVLGWVGPDKFVIFLMSMLVNAIQDDIQDLAVMHSLYVEPGLQLV